MSVSSPDLTTIFATVYEKSREARAEADEEAEAWLEEVRSGARSEDVVCVTSGHGGKMEGNHVAGEKHGDLVVPMCIPCHQKFSQGQKLWPSEWLDERRSPDIDMMLLLLGLHDLLILRSRHVPDHAVGAYLSLAASLSEQYQRVARRTVDRTPAP
ncbi:MAG: hypothetical protein ACREDK_06975 [Thermoplasmata archaeon]